MALNRFMCDGEESEFPYTCRGADHCITNTNDPIELCNNVYYSLSSNALKCDYLDLNKFDFDNFNTISFDSLILIHINIRSLNKNFDELYDFLQILPFTPDVICLSESRIKDQPLINIEISDYTFINTNPNGSASGVCMFVQNKLKFKEEKQFQLFGCDSLWLKLWDSQIEKKNLFITIYRHSGYKIDKFIDDYSQCLEQLTKINQLFYILGDLNINIKTSNISQIFKHNRK